MNNNNNNNNNIIIPARINGSLVHTTPEEFENAGFTLKTHQMFSVHTTSEKFANIKITGHFGFVFEENSVKETT